MQDDTPNLYIVMEHGMTYDDQAFDFTSTEGGDVGHPYAVYLNLQDARAEALRRNAEWLPGQNLAEYYSLSYLENDHIEKICKILGMDPEEHLSSTDPEWHDAGPEITIPLGLPHHKYEELAKVIHGPFYVDTTSMPGAPREALEELAAVMKVANGAAP